MSGSRNHARWVTRGLAMPVLVGLLLGLSATTGWASSPVATTNVDRWSRTVCSGVSHWMEQGTATQAQVQAVLADLGVRRVSGAGARKRLAQAYAAAVTTSDDLVTSVRAAGTPAVPSGGELRVRYLKTLSSYAGAYRTAAATLAKQKATSAASIATATQQVNAELVSELAVVGADPIEDLRSVPALSDALAAACVPVDAQLVKSTDAPCRAALHASQTVVDAERRFEAAPAGSAEEDAANSAFLAASDDLRSALAPCNVAGVVAPACRTALQATQIFVDAEARFEAAPVDSQDESTADDQMTAQVVVLEGQVPKCPG